jgi:hypothetical protein
MQIVNRVLGKGRNLLGYIEVAALKKKWEAGEVNTVSVHRFRPRTPRNAYLHN